MSEPLRLIVGSGERVSDFGQEAGWGLSLSFVVFQDIPECQVADEDESLGTPREVKKCVRGVVARTEESDSSGPSSNLEKALQF